MGEGSGAYGPKKSLVRLAINNASFRVQTHPKIGGVVLEVCIILLLIRTSLHWMVVFVFKKRSNKLRRDACN